MRTILLCLRLHYKYVLARKLVKTVDVIEPSFAYRAYETFYSKTSSN